MQIKSMPLDQYLRPHTGVEFLASRVVFNEYHRSPLGIKKRPEWFQYTMDKILLNLYKAWSINPDMTVGIMRKKSYWDGKNKSYVNPRLSYRNIVNALDYLMASDWLIEVQKGQQGFYGNHGISTRYRASGKLLDLFLESPIENIQLTYDNERPSVILRGKKPKKTKANPSPRGKLIEYDVDKNITSMMAKAKQINFELWRTDIGLYLTHDEAKVLHKKMGQTEAMGLHQERKFLTRIFNENFESGGRFFGGFWQEMPKEYRSRLTIGNCMVTEQDYSSIHFSILYKKERKESAQADPYDIGLAHRSINKLAMNIMLNSKSFEECLSACRKNSKILMKHITSKTMTEYLKSIENIHHPIKKYFYTGEGIRLQKIESDIAEDIMFNLIKNHKVVCLPVHDSFVIARRHLGLLIEQMNKSSMKILKMKLYSSPPRPEDRLLTPDLNKNKTNYYVHQRTWLDAMHGKDYFDNYDMEVEVY